MMKKNVARVLNELLERYPALDCVADSLTQACSAVTDVYKRGGTLYLCGNGGSACDGEHIAGELLKSFRIKRRMPDELKARFEAVLGEENIADELEMGLRAVSLNNHPGLSSAYINDRNPLMVYAQQLFAMGKAGDILLGISTSGNAANVYNAFKTARVMGITTILLTGENCGKCEKYADIRLKVPGRETYLVQEYHLPVYHALCAMLEETFYGTEE